ncbi:MAG: hypothetical protein LBP85_08480 [Prevotellaceae bacterium]|jgi:hypothetical protein|nr:hypothetical protein [Prevotellaceae bacterium]
MGKVNIEINGIVRDTSGQQSVDGVCEELINLRKRENVLIPVGVKKKETVDTDYVKVFNHKYINIDNQIGVLD